MFAQPRCFCLWTEQGNVNSARNRIVLRTRLAGLVSMRTYASRAAKKGCVTGFAKLVLSKNQDVSKIRATSSVNESNTIRPGMKARDADLTCVNQYANYGVSRTGTGLAEHLGNMSGGGSGLPHPLSFQLSSTALVSAKLSCLSGWGECLGSSRSACTTGAWPISAAISKPGAHRGPTTESARGARSCAFN
eukprot:gene21515-28498_t